MKSNRIEGGKMSGILHGDCLDLLPTIQLGSVQCVVTSPPYYGLRNYGIEPSQWPEISYKPMSGLGDYSMTVPAWAGCLGNEQTPEMFIAHLVHVFRLVRDVLRGDGTVWLNLGDSYSGSGKGAGSASHGKLGPHAHEFMPAPIKIPDGLKVKDLIGIPWRVALALQADGWYLRSDIIWAKPNAMPESVTDRPTKSHEHVFLLAKSAHYFYDGEAIAEPSITGWGGSRFDDGKNRLNHPAIGVTPRIEKDTKNKRDVWQISTQHYLDAHYAVFPPKLVEPCILAGSRVGDTVLDPFAGSGTTGQVAIEHNRHALLIEMKLTHCQQIEARTKGLQPRLAM